MKYRDLSWVDPYYQYPSFNPHPDEVWVIDNETGIVYQGMSHQGTGCLEDEVEDFLGQS